MIYSRICSTVVLGVMVVCPAALADEPAGKFTLARLVPADSIVYVHGVHNAEREFLAKHWSHVWEALKTSGIDADIKALISKQFNTQEEQADLDAKWSKAVDLCKGVRWSDLGHYETVMFMESIQKVAVLFRPKEETLQDNVRGLVAIMGELASLRGEGGVRESESHGGRIWTLGADGAPMRLNLFHRKTVVGFSSSTETVHSILASLAGEKQTAALVDAPRFQQAFSHLPKPEDTMAFIDTKKLFASIRDLARSESHQGQTNGSEVDEEFRKFENIMGEFDFIDYVASVEQTDGLRTTTYSVTQLSEGARTKKFCKAFVDQKPISGVLEHVPSDATGYSASSGADLGTLYSFGQDTIARNFDQGPSLLKTWAEWQQNNGFDLQEDLLSWIDGQVIFITFPAAIQTGMGGADLVGKFKVRDDAKALSSLNTQVDRFAESLMMAPAADVSAEGFRSVTHPMVAMFLKVTYGVKDGWLYVGSSSAAINKCLATAAGEASSFATNERFKSEGLVPKGAVTAASFADASNWGPQMAMGLGMGGPMIAAMLPPTPENQIPRSIAAMAGKLAPAVAAMNFTRSTSSISRLEGDRWMTESVVNYKEYKPREQVPDLADKRAKKEKVDKGLEGL